MGGRKPLRTASQFTLSHACSPVIRTSHAAAKSRTLFLGLMTESPADGVDLLEAAEACIEQEPDDADEEDSGDDEVVTLAGVAGVDDEVAESGVHGNHLRGDDDQPGDAEGDAQADEDLRQSGGKDDAGEELRGG